MREVHAIVKLGPFGALFWQSGWTFIAFLMVFAGVTDIHHPEAIAPRSPIWLSTVLAVNFLVGGLSIMVGLWRLWRVWELIGLLLLVLGTAYSLLVRFVYHAPGLPQGLLVFGVASLLGGTRIYDLLRGRRTIQVEIDG